jgi:diaminopimelate epimerase
VHIRLTPKGWDWGMCVKEWHDEGGSRAMCSIVPDDLIEEIMRNRTENCDGTEANHCGKSHRCYFSITRACCCLDHGDIRILSSM